MANGTSQTTGALGNLILRQQRRAARRTSETQRHRARPGTRTSISPAVGTREIFDSGLAQGILNLEADVQTFGAIGNILLGNEEAGVRRLNEASNLRADSQRFAQQVPTFQEALENPTFESFWQQGALNLGRVLPMMTTTVLSAGAGGIVGGLAGTATNTLSRMGVSKASQAAAREMVEEIGQRKLRGEALDAAENSLLKASWAEARRPKTFARRGAIAGAFGESYVVGSAQTLSEFEEAGYEIGREEAAIASILGVPQALLDTLGEVFFAKAMFTNAIRRTALGTILAKQRRKQALTPDEASVAALFNRQQAGAVLTEVERITLKEAAGANSFLGRLARDVAVGTGRSGLIEGLTETAQESLQIAQRFEIDKDYTRAEARLRLAEAAFAGTVAGTSRGAAGSTLASVFSQARDGIERGLLSRATREARAKQYGSETGFPSPEGPVDLRAQWNDLLNGLKAAMWVPYRDDGTTPFDPDAIEIDQEAIPETPTTDSAQIEMFEEEGTAGTPQLEMFGEGDPTTAPVSREDPRVQLPLFEPVQGELDVDIAKQEARQGAGAQVEMFDRSTPRRDIYTIETKTGVLYTSDKNLADAFSERTDEGPTDEMLRDALGYSEVRNPATHGLVVRVLNPEGRIVHEETTSKANEPTVTNKLEQRYANYPGYTVLEPVSVPTVVTERNVINETLKAQLEAVALSEDLPGQEGAGTGLEEEQPDVTGEGQLEFSEATFEADTTGYVLKDSETGEVRNWAPSGGAEETNKQRFLAALSPEERVYWETDERGRKRSVAEGEEQILTKVDTLSDSVINWYFKALEENPGNIFITDRAVPGRLAIALEGIPSGEPGAQAKIRKEVALSKAITEAVQLAFKGNRDGTNLLPGWQLHDVDTDGNPRVRPVDPNILAHAGRKLLPSDSGSMEGITFQQQLVMGFNEVSVVLKDALKDTEGNFYFLNNKVNPRLSPGYLTYEGKRIFPQDSEAELYASEHVILSENVRISRTVRETGRLTEPTVQEINPQGMKLKDLSDSELLSLGQQLTEQKTTEEGSPDLQAARLEYGKRQGERNALVAAGSAPIVTLGGRMVGGRWQRKIWTIKELQTANARKVYPEGTALELENLLLTDTESSYYDPNVALVTPRKKGTQGLVEGEPFEDAAARLQEAKDRPARSPAKDFLVAVSEEDPSHQIWGLTEVETETKSKSSQYQRLQEEIRERVGDIDVEVAAPVPEEERTAILEQLAVEEELTTPASRAGLIDRPRYRGTPGIVEIESSEDGFRTQLQTETNAAAFGFEQKMIDDPFYRERSETGVKRLKTTRKVPRYREVKSETVPVRRRTERETELASEGVQQAEQRLEAATTEEEIQAARRYLESERQRHNQLMSLPGPETAQPAAAPAQPAAPALELTPPPSAPAVEATLPPGVSYTEVAAEAFSMGDETGNFILDLKRAIDRNFPKARKIRVLLTEELDGPNATEITYFTFNEEATFRTEDGVELGNPNDYIRNKAAEMNRTNSPGKIISIGDHDIILLNLPREADGTISDVVITEGVLTLGHELGHSLFRQEVARAANNKGIWAKLNKAFEKARDAKGAPEEYRKPYGFEEWWADNMAIWLLNEGRKPTNGVESLLKRAAEKLRKFYKDIRRSLQQRFTRKVDPEFNTYVNQVIASYKSGLNPEETPLTTHNKVYIRDMADSLNEQTGRVIGKKNMRKLNALSKRILSQVQELLPSDRKHWASSWLLAPADNYLRRMGDAGLVIALMLYGRSQSQENPGYLNVVTRSINRRIEEFYSIMGAEDKANPTAEEQAAFLDALYEAEQESVATKDLSPQARRARAWKDEFFRIYVKPNNPNIHRRTNFFSRTFNLSEIENSKDAQGELLNILKAFNPSVKEEVLLDTIQAMLGQQEDTDAVESMSDYSLGMAAERVKFFRDIPNEAFRRGVDANGNINPVGSPDIELLISPEQAVQRYVENMVKRVEYNRLVHTTLQAGDLTALVDDKGRRIRGFEGLKVGAPLRGWRAMEVLINRIEDPVDRQGARDAVMAMLGRTGLGMNNYMRNINSGLLFMNIVTYLTFAVLASLPDLAGPILRSKNFSALPEAARQLTRYFKNPSEMQQFARELGVISRDSVSSMYINAVDMNYMTEGFRKGSDAFFKWTGTEWFTKFTRTFAAGMGEQFLIKHAQGRTELDNRYLKELAAGVSMNPRADILAWEKNNRRFDTPEGARVREMLGRFVDESIIRPNAAERPVWASNPYTALIWQLKSFFYAYGKNILGGHFREMKNRYSETGEVSMAAVPLLLGAVTLLPLTMIGLELREGIKWAVAGGDEAKLRTNGMGWWEYTGEIVDRAGYFGPYTLMLPLVGGQTYGGSPLIEPFGPTAERFEDILAGRWSWKDYMPFYASM